MLLLGSHSHVNTFEGFHGNDQLSLAIGSFLASHLAMLALPATRR